MKTLSIARKTLRELWREPLLLGVLLAFPLCFICFYYIGFGETEQGVSKLLKVFVLDQDQGAIVDGERLPGLLPALDSLGSEGVPPTLPGPIWTDLATGQGQEVIWRAGAQLTAIIRAVRFEGKPVFEVSAVGDRRAAETALREHKAALLVVIPPGFSRSLAGAGPGADEELSTISLVGDPTSDNFVFARSFLDDLVRGFARSVLGWDSPLTVTYEFVPGTGTLSDFQWGVPGMIVFGTMLLVITTAQTLVRENEGGTLQRLRLTCARPRELLLGVTLAQMAVAVVQVPLTLGVARALGFAGRGPLVLAIVVVLLLCLSAVGLGLLTACFARNDGEAANLGGLMGVFMVLVSGAVFPVPEIPIGSIAGHPIQIVDLLPPTHAAEALRRVLLQGAGLAEIGLRVASTALLSAILLSAGIVLYRRLRMRRA